MSISIAADDLQAVLAAVTAGDLNRLQAMTIPLAALDAADGLGRTPIVLALLQQSQALLDYFYTIAEAYYTQNDKLNVNQVDEKGRSIMHWAAKCNQGSDVVQALMAANADINDARNPFKVTPLYIAVQSGMLRAADALLQAGADAQSICINGATPLHAAAEIGSPELTAMLLQTGADVNHCCQQGGTALFAAAQKGHLPVVELLLQHQATVDAKTVGGATPLYVAAQNGHTEVVKVLLAAGASVTVTCNNGVTPLLAAKKNKHKETAKLLAAAGGHKGFLPV